jgi:hypothetical protein
MKVYETHNIVEKHFIIRIALERSRGGSVVAYKLENVIRSNCKCKIPLLVFTPKPFHLDEF